MRIIQLVIILCLPIISFGQDIQQSVIGSAGNEDKSDNASISWTVGEVVTETLTATNIVLSQGFHQGNLFISSIEEEEILEFSLTAYPNPVNDILTVNTQEHGLQYQVVDIHGKVLLNGVINSLSGQIDFTNIPSGVYFLQVDMKKTHKLIKQ